MVVRVVIILLVIFLAIGVATAVVKLRVAKAITNANITFVIFIARFLQNLIIVINYT